MYGWTEDTGSTPTPEKSGFDYASARKAYRSDEASGFSGSAGSDGSARSSGEDFPHARKLIVTPAPAGKNIETDSTHPIVIATDVTGSMAKWPSIIFEKLPLLGKEVERYAPGYSISFTAFGDSKCDSYPLQVRDFDKGEALDKHLSELYPEGNGGSEKESHNIAAYYYNEHCKIDKAIKPIFIMITDVDSHEDLTSGEIKRYIGDKIQSEALSSVDIFKKLSEKFSVYVLLKGTAYFEYWKEIFGAQRVKVLEEPRDIVEIIIGVIAGEVGEIKDFELRSSKRHEDNPERVERVMESLRVKDDVSASPEGEGKASMAREKSEKSKKSAKSASMKSKKLI